VPLEKGSREVVAAAAAAAKADDVEVDTTVAMGRAV
jgi:hypothetical protein